MTDGSVKHISSVERVKLDDDANVIGTLGVNVDVTVRTMAEQVVERGLQEHMRLKDEFLSHVSHELRSPLTAIKQFTSILAGGFAGALNEDQQTYQEIVLKNTRQLQAMIDDLLEITRLGTGKLTVNPDSMSLLDAVVDALNTIQGAARGKGITLSCDLPPDLPSAYADHTRIQQILIILLDNAIKFTPHAGAVHVRAERLREDARFLMLQVTDTGCGISQEGAANIFDRLYQVPASRAEGRKGLGLGLYICKELVSRQGGHIWVTPAPEGGTTFSITLPVFSLDTVLAPLFKQGRSPTEAMALVVVQMRFPDTWRGKDMQEVQSQELRKVLQRCLMPDLDVLLPSKRRDGEQVCFVAALADAQGAAVLVRRIRGQLEALLRPPEAGLSFTVSYRMLEPTPHEIGSSTDRLVQRLVSTVEEAMESHLLTEVASL